MKRNNKKTTQKFHSFGKILNEDLKSKKFRQIYDEELARLKLARQIRYLRIKKNLTQKTLAEKAKMPQSVVARIESGNHSYSLGTLSRIAQTFDKEIQLV